MSYTVFLMNGKSCDITEKEYKNLAGKSGLVHIPSIDCIINLSSVTVVEPKGKGRMKVDRSKQFEGFLHDGTRVLKQFGEWYTADGSRDESGRLESRPSPDYYPEVTFGRLPDAEEFETVYKHLPVSEWKTRLFGGNEELPMLDAGKRTSNSLEKI